MWKTKNQPSKPENVRSKSLVNRPKAKKVKTKARAPTQPKVRSSSLPAVPRKLKTVSTNVKRQRSKSAGAKKYGRNQGEFGFEKGQHIVFDWIAKAGVAAGKVMFPKAGPFFELQARFAKGEYTQSDLATLLASPSDFDLKPILDTTRAKFFYNSSTLSFLWLKFDYVQLAMIVQDDPTLSKFWTSAFIGKEATKQHVTFNLDTGSLAFREVPSWGVLSESKLHWHFLLAEFEALEASLRAREPERWRFFEPSTGAELFVQERPTDSNDNKEPSERKSNFDKKPAQQSEKKADFEVKPAKPDSEDNPAESTEKHGRGACKREKTEKGNRATFGVKRNSPKRKQKNFPD